MENDFSKFVFCLNKNKLASLKLARPVNILSIQSISATFHKLSDKVSFQLQISGNSQCNSVSEKKIVHCATIKARFYAKGGHGTYMK